uniref:Uncharacterized protein n=1 Tax=Quercus lobata TaxID=97700 RepID=A0A7N2KVA9_QUELO
MQSTQEDILNIKLGDPQTLDRLVWKENKAQYFTIRSAYLVALRLNHGGGGEHSKAQDDKRLWHKMWKMDVPPKTRRRNGLSCLMGVPIGHQWVGSGQRKIAEMYNCSTGFLLSRQTDEREAHGEGIRSLGAGQLVHLEH